MTSMAGEAHSSGANELDLIGAVVVDHLEIEALFTLVRSATTPQDRREAFERLVRKLAAHEAAEEEVIHPLTSEAEGGRRIGERRVHEELQAKRMLAKMGGLDVDEREFHTKFDLLEAAVLRHAEKEEVQEHPLLKETVEPARLRQLAELYRRAEEAAVNASPGVSGC